MIRSLRLFFLPSPENDFYPFSLRRQAIAFYLVFALALKLLSFFSVLLLPGTDFFASVTSQSIVALTNEERQLRGLPLLAENAILSRAASEKALDMLRGQYFSHNAPDGTTPWHWFQKNGYRFQYAGENLAIDFFNSSEAVKAWMDSPSHRANILNNNYRDTGIAVVSGDIEGRPTTLVVQLFGTLRSHTVTQPITKIISTPTILLLSPTPAASSEVLQQSPRTVSGVTATAEPVPDAELVAVVPATAPQKPKLVPFFFSLLLQPMLLYYSLLLYVVLLSLLSVVIHFKQPKLPFLVGALIAAVVISGLLFVPEGYTWWGGHVSIL